MKAPRKHPPTAHLKKTQWKPGQTGNPNGRPPLTAEQRALRKLTIDTYREVIETALNGTVDDLKALAQDPKTPAIQVGVATSILRAIKDGDPSILEQFAARIIGKIPEVINITSINTTNVNAAVAVVTDDELKARLKRIRSEL